MAADTTSRMPAATTPNTPKACLAIDAPFVSTGPHWRPDEPSAERSAGKRTAIRLESTQRLSLGELALLGGHGLLIPMAAAAVVAPGASS